MTKFNLIQNFVSKERLSTYVDLVGGEGAEVIELYKENVRLSEELYGLISEFEVVFRNFVNTELIKEYGIEWFDNPKLKLIANHTDAIESVKYELKRDGKPLNNPNVISNLNFGFWVYLFNKEYDLTLWRTCLYKIFNDRRSLSRSAVRGELDKIRKFRNRIAHCECILRYPYKQYADDIIKLLQRINKDAANWVLEVHKAEYLKVSK